nr:MurR/RpiR family transcriptional regulator [Winslowiella toletana]
MFGERFRQRKHLLSPRLHSVALYIHKHRGAILDKTALEIAEETHTSDATVVRAIQALGFSGLRDLKNVLAGYLGETLSSAARMASTVNALTPDTNSSIDFVLEGYRFACQVLAEEKNRLALSRATSLLQRAARVAVFGLGASGVLAEYTARLFNRNGTRAYVLNRTGVSLTEQLIAMAPGDVLIMMAQRSAHREGVTTLSEARRLGIPTILLTGSSDSLFIKEADTVIFIPRGVEAEKIPIHGAPLICLEILVLALAASAPQLPLQTMNRLYELNNSMAKAKKPLR